MSGPRAMQLVIRNGECSAGRQPIEVVERKGIGHPDTMCDGIAERVSTHLSRYYLEHFGAILHHNVDKALLCGGSARAAFGGGEVLAPMEIYLAGRATAEVMGRQIPVAELAVEACREWLRESVPEIELDRHVTIIPRLRPGSSDLAALFSRGASEPLANDTSCGVGFAPLTELERMVLQVERSLNDPAVKAQHPAIGRDIKVMGVRREETIALTLGCAFVARHVANLQGYLDAKQVVATLALNAAAALTKRRVEVVVNAADRPEAGELYLTVTGTSAEAGDDGEVGRGNRANGLITPYRPMTMEATAGKNPMNHVGKLYNVLANQICQAARERVHGVEDITCILVSRIGQPLTEPAIVDIQYSSVAGAAADVSAGLTQVIAAEFARLPAVRHALLAGQVTLF